MVAYFRAKRENLATIESITNATPKKGLISGVIDFVQRYSHKPEEQ